MYNLELNQSIDLDDFTTVIRVPKGWIYKFRERTVNGNIIIAAVFVPFNREFHKATGEYHIL